MEYLPTSDLVSLARTGNQNVKDAAIYILKPEKRIKELINEPYLDYEDIIYYLTNEILPLYYHPVFNKKNINLALRNEKPGLGYFLLEHTFDLEHQKIWPLAVDFALLEFNHISYSFDYYDSPAKFVNIYIGILENIKNFNPNPYIIPDVIELLKEKEKGIKEILERRKYTEDDLWSQAWNIEKEAHNLVVKETGINFKEGYFQEIETKSILKSIAKQPSLVENSASTSPKDEDQYSIVNPIQLSTVYNWSVDSPRASPRASFSDQD